VGFIAAVASAPVLIATTAKTKLVNVAGSCVFVVTMVLLYCASMLYHAVSCSARRQCCASDHGAIFLLIAAHPDYARRAERS
jgi:channel protein (hemolysin III family)